MTTPQPASPDVREVLERLVWIAGDKPEVKAIRDAIATLTAEVERLRESRDAYKHDAEALMKITSAAHDALVAAEAQLAAMTERARLIVDGAMPATTSGATCFVPRYQIDKLRDAIAREPQA